MNEKHLPCYRTLKAAEKLEATLRDRRSRSIFDKGEWGSNDVKKSDLYALERRLQTDITELLRLVRRQAEMELDDRRLKRFSFQVYILIFVGYPAMVFGLLGLFKLFGWIE